MVRTFAIFQRILITMDVYEISIFCPPNPMNDTTQFREDLKEIYRKLYYNMDIRTMLRHLWIVSGWQRYFWISVPLTHHYKKCPVMWMIIELISKNQEISLSSRNNPEMSQRSSDVPIVVKFSIYIYFLEIFSELGGIIQNICFSIQYNAFPYIRILWKIANVRIFWCFCRVNMLDI